MKLRLGLIGQGDQWQARYQPALRLMRERFVVSAVYNSVGALAEATANDFQAARCDGLQHLMKRSDVDAVLMLEKDWYRHQPILAACDHGKAVLCGSEIVFTTQETQRLSQRIEKAGIAFMTEFSRRLAPATLRLKELIATHLGPPKLLFCHQRLSAQTGAIDSLISSQQESVQRELVELIDWCSYIVDFKPAWVQSVEHRVSEKSDLNDYQSMSLGFCTDQQRPNPVIAQISCGTYFPPTWQEAIGFRPPAAIQVCCEQGIAFLDLPNSLVWFDSAGRHQESLDSELPVGQQLLTHFYRAVTSLVRRTSGLEDMFRAITSFEKAAQSSSDGKRMTLDFSTRE